MLSLQSIKSKAKDNFYVNKWPCIFVAFISSVIGTASIMISNIGSDRMISYDESSLSTNTNISIGFSIVTLLLSIFVTNVIAVGACRFFLKNGRGETPEITEIFSGFTHNYGNTMLTMFITDLYILLWTLLFIIPGIVKSFSYMLIPYILANTPDTPYNEAIAKSQEMMQGHKMEAFKLVFSFIGWWILDALTLGILGFFFVDPYYRASLTEFYESVAGNHVSVNV